MIADNVEFECSYDCDMELFAKTRNNFAVQVTLNIYEKLFFCATLLKLNF